MTYLAGLFQKILDRDRVLLANVVEKIRLCEEQVDLHAPGHYVLWLLRCEREQLQLSIARNEERLRVEVSKIVMM